MVLIPLILCTRACVIALLLSSACHLVLGVGLPHNPRVSMGVTLLVFSGGAAALRPITCGPLPHPKIHHRNYINGIPLNAKVSGAWQKWDGTSKVCLHYTFHKNGVQAQYQMETHKQTNPHIQDARWAGICQQCKIPVPPWKLVPCVACVPHVWSRLVQTTLRCVASSI